MKVFVVEDSPMLRQRLVSVLSQIGGVEVVGEAKHAAGAMGALRELRPEVVTLDIHTPGGINLLKQIKQEHHAAVVMILTDDVSPLYLRNCLAAGADFVLDKLTELTKLRVIIEGLRQWLGSSRPGRGQVVAGGEL